MATIHVSDTEALLAALKSATGGDTIVLADGDYGALNLSLIHISEPTRPY